MPSTLSRATRTSSIYVWRDAAIRSPIAAELTTTAPRAPSPSPNGYYPSRYALALALFGSTSRSLR
jgi:hypothetical protein